MPGVTISSSYGTGGSIVAPLVAERLGLPLLDRAISAGVAAQLRVSLAEAEDAQFKRSRADRFLSVLAPLAIGVLSTGSTPDAAVLGDAAAPFREQAEAIMQDALAAGAVILGRAGAAAFVGRPDVLRVRLFGSKKARVEQAARLQGVDVPTAEKRRPEVDEARAQYVRRLYDVDIDDPALYDLQIDSTRLPPETCADLVASAYRALVPA
ncbi:MAG TPA: cytidylate kinase-like family protein [Mycobacteriales bacterium]